MGQFCSAAEPIPAHSTLNEQRLEWGTCYCGYTGQVVPSWMADTPNAELLALGLSQQGLQSEIEEINQRAVEFMQSKSNACRYYWWAGAISAALMVIAALIVILIIDSSWIFVIFGVIGGATLVFYAFYYAVLCYYLKHWNQCLEHIEQYLRNEMNAKYTQQKIHWSVRKRRERHGCGRGSYMVQYTDIVVTPSAKFKSQQATADNADRDTTALLHE